MINRSPRVLNKTLISYMDEVDWQYFTSIMYRVLNHLTLWHEVVVVFTENFIGDIEDLFISNELVDRSFLIKDRDVMISIDGVTSGKIFGMRLDGSDREVDLTPYLTQENFINNKFTVLEHKGRSNTLSEIKSSVYDKRPLEKSLVLEEKETFLAERYKKLKYNEEYITNLRIANEKLLLQAIMEKVPKKMTFKKFIEKSITDKEKGRSSWEEILILYPLSLEDPKELIDRAYHVNAKDIYFSKLRRFSPVNDFNIGTTLDGLDTRVYIPDEETVIEIYEIRKNEVENREYTVMGSVISLKSETDKGNAIYSNLFNLNLTEEVSYDGDRFKDRRWEILQEIFRKEDRT